MEWLHLGVDGGHTGVSKVSKLQAEPVPCVSRCVNSVLRGKTLTELFAEGKESQWQHFAPVASICLETVRFHGSASLSLSSTHQSSESLGLGTVQGVAGCSKAEAVELLTGAIADDPTGIAQFHFSKMEAVISEMVWLVHSLTFAAAPPQDEAQDFVIIAASCLAQYETSSSNCCQPEAPLPVVHEVSPTSPTVVAVLDRVTCRRCQATSR